MAGQTINDRLLAARHSLAGQGLAKSVCKATTEEMIGPKKKHLDYLVHCTNEPNVSIPHLANLLVERTQSGNWVVVYKSLLTVHHLLAYGNERFMQYLASSNSTFNLSNFLDKGGVQGTVGARIGYDMSPFIRRYAKYLNDKALSYRTVAFDFCKVKRGKEEGSLRTMNADKLLKTLPVLQAQLDGLLEFDCQSNDLTNGVINMCFMLLFRDLIRLFACYNDGIINLLEKYFDMNKKQCKDALDLYKKFLVRMDRVGEFLKVAENVGIDKGDIPDLTKAPSSLLEALEGHLAAMEGRKGSAANTPTQSASHHSHSHHSHQQQQENNVKSAVYALSTTSSSFGTAAASGRFDAHGNGIDDAIKAQALAEEEAAMNQYRQTKVGSPSGGGGASGAAAATNPFLSSPVASQANIVDLFGGGPTSVAGGNQLVEPAQPATSSTTTKASEDLLQLGNPFADMFGGAAPAQPPSAVGLGQPADLASAVGNNNGGGGLWSMKSGFDALGDVLKPAGIGGGGGGMSTASQILQHGSAAQSLEHHTTPIIGTGLQHQHQQQQQQPPSGKVLTGDLDSSLASLAENLTINKSASAQVKGVQWNSPKNAAKPASWTPQPMAATTGAGYRPMAQGLTIRPAPSTLQYPNMQSSFSNISPIMTQQQPGAPMRPPPMQPQPPMQQQPTVAADQNGAAKQIQLDPFGAF